jgi:hypothetical protein
MSQAEINKVDQLLKLVQVVTASLFTTGVVFLFGYTLTH